MPIALSKRNKLNSNSLLTGFVKRLTPYPLLLTFCFVGCAAPMVPSRVVFEDPVHFIRLEVDSEAKPEEPDTLHSHPSSILVEQMAELLRGFQVRTHRLWIHAWISGQAKWEPVFEEDEVDLLAVHLTEALRTVEPTERVAYYLSRPRTSIKREITTGGLYVDGTSLHFTLSNHRVLYGVPAYGLVYDRRYPTKPTAPKWFDLSFARTEAIATKDTGFFDFLLGNEKDEIVINLEVLEIGPPMVQELHTGGVEISAAIFTLPLSSPHV